MLRTDGPLGHLAGFVVRRAGWMLALWIALAATLNVIVPQLEDVIANDNTPFVPDTTTALLGQHVMEEAFGSLKTNSYVYVVMARDGGLTDADSAYYRSVADRLGTIEAVTAVTDMSVDQQKLDSVTSKDGEARYLVVGLSGNTGAPSGTRQVAAVRDAARADVPHGLDIEVTGVSATVADLAHQIESKLIVITMATVLMIGALLQYFYRSFVVTAIGLGLIGLSLASSRALTAWFGLHVFAISTFTGSFITGVVVGTGTDYFIFTLSRYYDQRRAGLPPREAAHIGAAKIAPVIIGSGVTVILANAAAIVADVAFFRTTGPAISVAVAATLAISLTATPALIAVAGSRGWLEPPAPRAGGYWRRSADRVLRAPAKMFVVGLVPLGLLAAFTPLLDLEYDQTRNQPEGTESNRGYRLIADHFPVDEVVPEFVIVRSATDMRTTPAFAALEQMALDVSRVDGVSEVRGVTRPTGAPIEAATVSAQAGKIGDQLATDAAAGAAAVLDGLDDLRDGVAALGSGTSDAVAGSALLRTATAQLADGLSLAHSQAALAVAGLGQAYAALQADLLCTIDPICNAARAGIGQIYLAQRDQMLPGLAQAAAAAHDIADGTADLASGLARIDSGLAQAHSGADQLTAGQSELRSGLDAAAAYLRQLGQAGGSPSAHGFFVPKSLLDSADFAASSRLLLSADGKTARYMVLGDAWPFDRAAMDRASAIIDTARHSLADTALADAQVLTSGQASFNHELKRLSNADFLRTAAVALLTVLAILLVLLRAPLAALFLVGTVIVSYAAAVGLGVLFWQELLHTPIDWTIPTIAFILLVAVGADYNLLLMKRVQECAEDGADPSASIADAVASTGSVITTAGIIFAASMFALVAGDIVALSQMGTIVGVGLLLDTFIVRTLLVPAGAALAGGRLWWPRSSAATSSAVRRD